MEESSPYLEQDLLVLSTHESDATDPREQEQHGQALRRVLAGPALTPYQEEGFLEAVNRALRNLEGSTGLIEALLVLDIPRRLQCIDLLRETLQRHLNHFPEARLVKDWMFLLHRFYKTDALKHFSLPGVLKIDLEPWRAADKIELLAEALLHSKLPGDIWTKDYMATLYSDEEIMLFAPPSFKIPLEELNSGELPLLPEPNHISELEILIPPGTLQPELNEHAMMWIRTLNPTSLCFKSSEESDSIRGIECPESLRELPLQALKFDHLRPKPLWDRLPPTLEALHLRGLDAMPANMESLPVKKLSIKAGKKHMPSRVMALPASLEDLQIHHRAAGLNRIDIRGAWPKGLRSLDLQYCSPQMPKLPLTLERLQAYWTGGTNGPMAGIGPLPPVLSELVLIEPDFDLNKAYSNIPRYLSSAQATTLAITADTEDPDQWSKLNFKQLRALYLFWYGDAFFRCIARHPERFEDAFNTIEVLGLSEYGDPLDIDGEDVHLTQILSRFKALKYLVTRRRLQGHKLLEDFSLIDVLPPEYVNIGHAYNYVYEKI